MNMPLIFCQLWKIERGMTKQVLWITIDYSILTTTEDRMAVCVCRGPHMHLSVCVSVYAHTKTPDVMYVYGEKVTMW